MPNWCNNTFELVAPKEKVREFEFFLNEKNGKDWFDFFLPCPQELKDVGNVSFHHTNEELEKKYGHSDWYSWSVSNWGCKWNCDAQDWNVEDYDEENLSIRFWFDSPWGPPTELYSFISQQEDLNVFANFHEEGMAFVGKFEYGDIEQYEYSDLDSLDGIPDDIIEEWNLREMLEEQAEWEEDEESEEENDIDEVPNANKEDLEEALDELKKEFNKLMKEEENGKSS